MFRASAFPNPKYFHKVLTSNMAVLPLAGLCKTVTRERSRSAILSSHLRAGLSSGLFPLGFQTSYITPRPAHSVLDDPNTHDNVRHLL